MNLSEFANAAFLSKDSMGNVDRSMESVIRDVSASEIETHPEWIPPQNFRGNSWEKVHNILGSEQYTEPLIAAIFWQMVARTSTFPMMLREAGATVGTYGKVGKGDGPEMIVVTHGANNFSLLVFDPFLPVHQPRQPPFTLLSNSSILTEAGKIWKEQMSGTFQKGKDELASAIIGSIDTQLAFDLYRNPQNNFKIIVTHPPELEQTASPSPFWGVSPQANALYNSTLGTICQDQNGNWGGIVSLHSLDGLTLLPGKTQISINGLLCTIVSLDAITDSCLVHFPPGFVPPSGTGNKGPLQNICPRQFGKATFEGLTSGHGTATITGVSHEMPFVQPNVQLKVYTTPCTNPGDSGSSLIDDQDYLIGFSQNRSGLAQPIQYSAWIWPHSVYEAHKLKY